MHYIKHLYMQQTKKPHATQRVITVEFTVKFTNYAELTDEQFVENLAVKTGNRDVKIISRGVAEPQTA